uniref:Uncharacterized protein n=1 Tax=Suricata suricatta TaxID=37032 RepID=A0A673V799_SURSU
MDGLQKTAIGMQYKGGDLSWSGRSTEMGDVSLRLSFLLILLLCLPTAMGFHNSAIKVDGREGLLQRVKPPLLMSPVFNHHTVEWFYAYFICISLNRVSEGHSEPGVYKVGQRGKKKGPYDACLQTGTCSMICLLLLLKSL